MEKAAIKSLLLGFIFLVSFVIVESDHKAATVKQIKGISVFIMSEPKAEYTYLGTVKKSFALSGANDEMINGIVNKTIKDYPTADGVIFNTLEFEKGDVIKFK